MAKSTQTSVVIEGKKMTLTNLGKVLYPAAGYTKAHVLDYYQKISPAMLPYLKSRMLTLKRYPHGVEGEFFYEKRCPVYRPSWLRTKTIKSSKKDKEPIPYCGVDNLPGLIWIANLASIEFHILLSTREHPDRPTEMVFDLDPGAPADLKDCSRIALRMNALFGKMKLQAFPKTSGGKGLHLYVPLNTPVTFDETKNFARKLAELFQKLYPEETTYQMKKALRPGKIFIDWSQNDSHKTTVCVYSMRARTRPTISTPLKWSEVEACADGKKKPEELAFEAEAVLKRVQKYGDLFAPVLKLKQKLPEFRGRFLLRICPGAGP